MGLFRRVVVCPFCKCGLAVTSRLRGAEWGLVLLPVRPRRCLGCRLRFWRPAWLARLLPGWFGKGAGAGAETVALRGRKKDKSGANGPGFPGHFFARRSVQRS
jgi:hypothetical protein